MQQKKDAKADFLTFLNETLGLAYRDWGHYKEHYDNWKTAMGKRNLTRKKSGAAPIPFAPWENELSCIEENNPKINPDKRVISYFGTK